MKDSIVVPPSIHCLIHHLVTWSSRYRSKTQTSLASEKLSLSFWGTSRNSQDAFIVPANGSGSPTTGTCPPPALHTCYHIQMFKAQLRHSSVFVLPQDLNSADPWCVYDLVFSHHSYLMTIVERANQENHVVFLLFLHLERFALQTRPRLSYPYPTLSYHHLGIRILIH